MASPEKDVPPCHLMLCLGIWINTLDMIFSVPSFRVSEFHQELHKWLNKSLFTRLELQQLLGKLSFVSACVRPGRAFISRLLKALCACFSRPKNMSFPLTDDLRSDLDWWLFFLSQYNGISVIPFDVLISKIIPNILQPTLATPVAGRFVSESISTANYRISFSLKIYTSMNWNSLLLWSPSNCGHASLPAPKWNSFRTILPASQSSIRSIPLIISCSNAYKNSGCSLPCLTSSWLFVMFVGVIIGSLIH